MTNWTAPSFPDQASDDPNALPENARTTILLVDDDNDCRDVVRQILELKGFSVHTAALPEQAIEIAIEAARIDLLISDVVMPGQNGYELYKKLQSQIPGLPAIFISGCPIALSSYLGKKDAAVNFLQKPFHADKLLAMVQTTLRSQAIL